MKILEEQIHGLLSRLYYLCAPRTLGSLEAPNCIFGDVWHDI